MDISNVEKKLREAIFFVNKMAECGRMAFGDHEEFDFYLSAFLNAARSVDYRLRFEQDTLYKTWRQRWSASLPAAECRLMEFFANDRAAEVHRSGSARDEKEINIPVGNMYEDASGIVYASGPPGDSEVSIIKPDYFFTIDGVERKAVEASGEYLQLLRRMVESFKMNNP